MQIQVLPVKDTISKDLEDRLRKLSAVQRRQLHRAMGEAVVSLAKQAFRDPAVRPAPWAALAPRTLAARRAKGRKGTAPLIDSGTLARSPRVVEVTYDYVTVGSDRRTADGRWSLAAIHQYGAPRRSIPARPFFPFEGTVNAPPRPTAQLKHELDRIVRRHLDR